MKSNVTVNVAFEVTLTLTEIEARALDAICGYNYSDFIKTFKKHMGESYIKGKEEGAKSLFDSVKHQIGPALSEVRTSRVNIGLAIENADHRLKSAQEQ